MTPIDRSRLPTALLDFERSPGRYRVVLREPRALFEHIGSVMQIAAGRPVEGLPAEPANAPALRRAARFFVRTVMLRPGSDPLTLLGLHPGFEPAQLREHYRLMIRLTHPDFDAAGEGWPADAATRVNLANDRLSSPEKRAQHALAWHTPAGDVPAAIGGAPRRPQPLLPQPARPRPTFAHDETRAGWRSLRARLVLAGMGAVFMAGAFLLVDPMDNEGALVVRRDPPVQAPVLPPSPEPGTPSPEDAAPLQDAARVPEAPRP